MQTLLGLRFMWHCYFIAGSWGRDALSVRLWIPEAQELWQLSG